MIENHSKMIEDPPKIIDDSKLIEGGSKMIEGGSKMIDIIVVGSLMMDFISYVDKLPKPGETLHSNSFEIGFGGKGANQCITAARLSDRDRSDRDQSDRDRDDREIKVGMIGKIGNDNYGLEYKEYLESERINTEFLEIENSQKTGIAFICVDSKTGENQIIINSNANSYHWEDSSIQIKQFPKILICQLEIPIEASLKALSFFKSKKVLTILNAAPAPPCWTTKIPDGLFLTSDIICVNETEAETLTNINVANFMRNEKGNEIVHKCFQEFLRKGSNMVIITLGKDGAVFCYHHHHHHRDHHHHHRDHHHHDDDDNDSNDENGDPTTTIMNRDEDDQLKDKVIYMEIPSPSSSNSVVIDTVGAGDAFIGGLAYFIAKFPKSNWIQKIGASLEIATHTVYMKGSQTSYKNFPIINPTTKNYHYKIL